MFYIGVFTAAEGGERVAQDLNDIINQLDLAAFIDKYLNLDVLRKNERKWYCVCPFCGNGNKKFSINMEQGSKKSLFGCFVCGEKGNIISLYAKLNGCSNGQAVKVIKEFAGIEDNYNKVVPIKSKSRKTKPNEVNKGNVGTNPPKVKQKDVPTNLSGQNQTGGVAGGGDDIPPWDEEDGLTGGQDNKDGNNDAQEAKDVDSEDDGGGPSEDTARGTARPRDIYSSLVRVAALTDAHRQELRSRRGFTDATIDRLAFRSGGEYMAGAIEQLREQYADEDLEEAGILVDVNGTLVYNQQLLEDRVLIPYLDEKNEVYHLRPHKLGFKDIPLQAYCRLLLSSSASSEIVLTEGEFKAAALYQCGIPAMAIPGISSFGDRYFDRLVELCRLFDVKKITVVFDNEVKDNPELPNFKKKPEDRFDTDFWAYMMAYRLGREGFVTRVGRLPDDWRQDGKIDFDGALAQGRTSDDILKVISQAQTPAEFRESLTEDAKRVVNRKITKHFTKSPIRREFNKYVITNNKGDNSWETTISNFVIDIKSSFFTPDGVIRNVQFVNEYGERSDIFPLTPTDMAGLNEFKKFCFGKGNYVFEGTSSDLLNVWKFEFLRDMGELIYMPDCIGYQEDEHLWLFGNMAIKRGKVYRPDNDGIIWIDNKGYKPQSLQISSRGEAMEDAIPALKEKPVDLSQLADRLKQTIGGYEAYIGMGWAIATIFSKDIFQKYKCMPILFPHGKRESGKSTFMRWIMSFFGVEIDGVGIAETTQNYIARALSYYSSLGCWFDEYRNEYKVIQKDGFFRSAYNRQMSGKGTATAFQAKGFSVRAAVAISGEELPKDNGLFTRLVPLQISSYRRDRTWFDWLQKHCSSFSYFTYYLLLNYDKLLPRVMKTIAELKEALLEKDITDRTAENWAICAGAFWAVVLQDEAFIHWVEETCQDIKRTGENEHMLNQFLTDLGILFSNGELDKRFIGIRNNVLYLWFAGVYGSWAKYYRNKTGREPFDEQSIRKYIQEEPYCKPDERYYFSDGRKRAVAIDLTAGIPEAIEEIVSMYTDWEKTKLHNYLDNKFK